MVLFFLLTFVADLTKIYIMTNEKEENYSERFGQTFLPESFKEPVTTNSVSPRFSPRDWLILYPSEMKPTGN